MSELILTLHPQGEQGVNIDKAKYEAIRNAIFEALNEQGEMTFGELNPAVNKNLGAISMALSADTTPR